MMPDDVNQQLTPEYAFRRLELNGPQTIQLSGRCLVCPFPKLDSAYMDVERNSPNAF